MVAVQCSLVAVCTATKFSRNTLLLSYIVVSQTFKLKLISAKFLLPMISFNELSITLYITLSITLSTQ